MFLYRTYFRLEAPVNDISEARDYLSSDDMTQYMKYDKRIPFFHKINNIKWILTDESSGHIDLETSQELTDDELSNVSDWVSGQNSDGLGEGFEQQSFACYEDNDYYGYNEDEDYDDYEDNFVMASFDWRTNDYKFELISAE